MPRVKENGLVETSRQREVRDLLVLGLSTKEIAERLCIEPKTVKGHLTNLYKLFRVKTRYQLVVKLHGKEQEK